MKIYLITLLTLFSISLAAQKKCCTRERPFNDFYCCDDLNMVAFPMGGIGAGMICMDGTGSISHVSINNKPDVFNTPYAYAAIMVEGVENGAKVLQTQVPYSRIFGMPGNGRGSAEFTYGLPRFKGGEFLPRFPFATLSLEDDDIPLEVSITGWSPFIPGDEDNSSLPVAYMEYHFKNNSNQAFESVFSWNSKNFLKGNGIKSIASAKNGFTCVLKGKEGESHNNAWLTATVDDNNAVVDHCWFRGGWWDSNTIAWKNIKDGNLVNNAAVEKDAPGASIFVPFKLQAGEEKTIRLQLCWYVPNTKMNYGQAPKLEAQADTTKECCTGGKCEPENPYYQPWYAGRFKSIQEVSKYLYLHSYELKKKSELFRDAFYASSLPPEVVEAVAANLTILKSPTVLRQTNGKLWAWEGCNDDSGCCAGSCTHVWNYAQAIPHLFPALERSLRETEFKVSQNKEGHQTFRAGLPIKPVGHGFHAASDGQLGGIMKVYREWRISGDNEWIKKLYPLVKQSLDYCIHVWDPKHKGILEEPHHNTYDIEFWGPDGMCTSFYLGALTAMVEMSKELSEPYDNYEKLIKKGSKFMEKELFDGEYYIHKIQWEGLEAKDPIELSKSSWTSDYSDEAKELLQKEGPKYQYGTGCLSDGILGMWMADVCGLPEVLNNEQVTSHLNSIHKYNLKTDLRNHPNPQRPSYACGKEGGLLLCTWPKGGELSLPFVYSNEVWTGIEYQVASHLMFKGEVEKGLEIVREVRRRYDGKKRNPFNEYECGHWYARAMASYGLIQGLTGVRYDAVTKTLFIDSKVGDSFTSFLSTEMGFGNVGLKDGKPFIDVKYGNIEVNEFVVNK